MADQPGVSTPQMVAEAGITYRQLDYWARAGLLRPDWHEGVWGPGQGGRSRTWTAAEQRVARLMGRLTAAGINPRTAEQVARSAPARFEIGPGIWIQINEEVPGG